MDSQFETIAQLESSALRRSWLLNHYPLPDHNFIQTLQAEAHRVERDDSRKAHTIAQLIGDAAELWDDRQTLATALRVEAQSLRTAEPLTALRKYEEAVRIYQSLGLEHLAVDAAIGQVATLRVLGRYTAAFDLNQDVIAYFRHADDGFGLARALLNHGLISYYLGDYQQARSHYAEAHRIFTALEQPQWCAAVESNDANVLEELNEYAAAEAQYRQARTYYVASAMHNAAARIDHNLAYLHFVRGDYQKALQLFGEAREQFLAQESDIDVAFVDLYRTEIYLRFNLWRKAIDLARHTRYHFERAQMPWETAQLLLNEALALLSLQKSELALEQLGQARRLLTQLGPTHWQALVDLYESMILLRTDQLDAAARIARQARAYFQQSGLLRRVGQCELILGQVALADDHLAEAALHFSKAAHDIGPYGSPVVNYHYHVGLAHIYQRQANAAQAEVHYGQALAAIERAQRNIGAEDYKLAFLGDKVAVYEQFIQFCLAQQDPTHEQTAFAVLEQAKLALVPHAAPPSAESTALTERTHPADSQAEATQELQQIRQLKQELNRYYTQFHTPDAAFASDADVARLHTAIVQCELRLSNLLDSRRRLDFVSPDRDPMQPIPLPQLQAAIPSGTILLEYFFSEERLTIFCIERTSFTVHRRHFCLEHLQDLVHQLRFQMNKFHLGTRFRERHRRLLQQSMDQVLQQFYQLLIAPVAGLLENAEHLIIVPHHLLHNLPFHAFFDGRHYLLETHGVSYAISATFHHLVQQQAMPATFAPPLVLGLNDSLIRQAEQEALAVAAIFPEAECYCGAAATATHLQTANQPRPFIHLATHGIFRSDNPVYSALKLADGWFTMQELAALRHSAPLITLSACDTGRSETPRETGLTDFYRSFFRSGAQAVVVSLWSLDDQAAIRIMTIFYEELRRGRAVYDALRTAQQRMMARWRHPYYWAPFMLTGNPQLHHLVPSLGQEKQSDTSSRQLIELHP